MRILPVILIAGFSGCGKPKVERVEWPVMGTVAAVQWKSGGDLDARRAVALARSEYADVEKLLNAHVADSEVSRLAPFSEDEILLRCSEKTHPCYAAAFRLARESEGAFNPRWRGTNTLDLGAIAKGFAVDLAFAKVKALTEGARTLLDLGGNLRSVGDEWAVGVLDADGKAVCRRVLLRPSEALATSAEYFRGKHIYDGRTNRPVTNGVASVTVLATSAMLADGLSTTLFVLAPERGLEFVRRLYPEDVVCVLYVLSDGRQVVFDPDARLSPPLAD